MGELRSLNLRKKYEDLMGLDEKISPETPSHLRYLVPDTFPELLEHVRFPHEPLHMLYVWEWPSCPSRSTSTTEHKLEGD